MADRKSAFAGQANAGGSAGKQFPPEAYEHHDEVSTQEIDKMKAKVGIDFDDDQWEVVGGFGKVIVA